jgi:hypothetical protein
LVFIYEKEGRKGIGNATIFRKIELFVKHTTSLYLRQVEPKDECWDCSSLQPPLVELHESTHHAFLFLNALE